MEVLTNPRQLDDPQDIDVAFWRPDSRSWEVAAFARQVPMALEGLGVPFVNSLPSCDRATNKLVSGLLFDAAGIPTPALQLAPQAWETDDELAMPAGAVITKPVEGKASREVKLFPSASTALDHLEEADGPFLIQQAIDWTQLVRLVMSRDGAVRYFEQANPEANAGPTITRVNSTWPEPVDKVPDDAESIAMAMLNAVGGDLMRADLLRDATGELWALEINASFGFPHEDERILTAFTRQLQIAAATGKPSH